MVRAGPEISVCGLEVKEIWIPFHDDLYVVDDLVGLEEERQGDGEAEGLGGLEVDYARPIPPAAHADLSGAASCFTRSSNCQLLRSIALFSVCGRCRRRPYLGWVTQLLVKALQGLRKSAGYDAGQHCCGNRYSMNQ
jgi:hypothetical protein